MDQTRDEVRIMTVHAAKGLEAPVVFLVDSGAAPFSDQHLPRLMPFEPTSELWQGKGYLWRVGRRCRQRLLAAVAARMARERADDEYRRLLYVGMTRAEDRLIVCGYHGKRTPTAATWHAIVDRGAGRRRRARQLHASAVGREVHRFRVDQAPLPRSEQLTGSADQPSRRPAACRAAQPLPPAPICRGRCRRRGASALIEEATDAVRLAARRCSMPSDEPSFAIARGLAMHACCRCCRICRKTSARRRRAAISAASARDWPSEERRRRWRCGRCAFSTIPAFAPLFRRRLARRSCGHGPA